MMILGIESAGTVASVALLLDGSILAEYSLNTKYTHSQTLLPMIDEIMERSQMRNRMNELDAIAYAAGPGSFTGLRIGGACAKGLGFALKKPLVAVPTLPAMAMRCWGAQGVVAPLMDARRGQVYTGIYEFDRASKSPEPAALSEREAIAVDELCAKLNELGRPVTFLGDGCDVSRQTIEMQLQVPYVFAPAHMNRQSASCVAMLGAIYFEKGMAESAAEAGLDYLRPSQAERVKAEKTGQSTGYDNKKNDAV